MRAQGSAGRAATRTRGWVLATGASFAAAVACADAASAASLELNTRGELAIDGRRVTCKASIQTILDARLPNLGIATRTQLVLNPQLLRRMSPTVRLFVYHHECGHHHVGGDELGADCWAVKAGVADGWLQAPQIGEICASFGTSKATATHPATAHRCRALQACFNEATRTPSQTARAGDDTAALKPTTPSRSPSPSPQLVHEGFTAAAPRP